MWWGSRVGYRGEFVTTEERKALKPCPFCGAAPTCIDTEREIVRCFNCPPMKTFKAWNTRHEAVPVSLEKCVKIVDETMQNGGVWEEAVIKTAKAVLDTAGVKWK